MVYSVSAPRLHRLRAGRSKIDSNQIPIDAGAKFAMDGEQRAVLDLRPDSSPDWEVSFYRSLSEADGVVLLGGGRSTYVAGSATVCFQQSDAA